MVRYFLPVVTWSVHSSKQNETRKSPEREKEVAVKREQHAFTLIELLVVIAIIAILMGIMMPALQRVKSQAQEMTCRANLRQYGIAQTMYTDEFDGRYPSAWTSLVRTEQPVPGYERYCRWHDPRYPADCRNRGISSPLMRSS